MDKKLDVYVTKPNPAPKGWKRKMGVLGWHGDELYISAVIAGYTDDDAALCSMYDGVPCAYAEKTVLVPEAWARKEKPERAPLFDKVRERAIAVRKLPNV